MPISEWLDIAVGVVLVWFLFSLIVSALNEAITRVLAIRAKELWQALNQMLDGEAQPKGLIVDLLRAPRRDDFRPDDPAKTTSVTEQLYGTKTIQVLESRPQATKKTRLSSLPAPVFAQALIELAIRDAAGGERSIDDFLASLPDTVPLKAQLTTLWATAKRDVTQFRHQVEEWFDGQMSRLGGLYKSKVRVVLVVLGLAVSIGAFGLGMRTDSIALVADLQRNADLRVALATTAGQATSTNLAQQGAKQPEGGGCDASAPTATVLPLIAPGAAECQLLGVRSLKGMDLAFRSDIPGPSATFANRLGLVLGHWRVFVGVVITGVAISFGSTFWFDLLRRLVGMRSGGGSSG
jgi:hypothetical protein